MERCSSLTTRAAAAALLLLGAIAATAAWCDGRDAAEEPVLAPNIVFILADDLGWADLGCHGADLHRTPHLDGLARRGVRFTNAYAAAPVCTPTRASVMTGKYPARLHMTVWFEASQRPPRNRPLVPPVTVGNLAHGEVTHAEALSRAGYFTAHVGKWHLGDAAHYPETQGFDVNVGGTFWGAPSTFFYPYRGLWSNTDELRYVPGLEWGEKGEYLTDRLTDEAIRIVERVRDRPFFLSLWYHTVHTPIEAKAEVVDRYRKRLEPGLHHRNPTYAAMVDSLDENVGRLLARLDDLELSRRTLIVFTSDNGGYINRHRGMQVTSNHPLRSGKGSLWEGGIRVPLIVRWPGVTEPGGVCHEPVISNDFYPTLLEAVGVAPAAPHDGVSLVPLLRDPNARLERDALYWHYPHYYPTTTPVSAVRAGRWKLLEFHESGELALHDLHEDPAEARNLADDMPERAQRLLGMLRDWRREVDAQMPTPSRD